jgi:phospholipid/cholesterol/gamma-HCH transport system substrate-binding protein
MKSAAKVGVLLVVFVVLIIASFTILGRSLLAQKRKTFYVSLSDAGGINQGTRVLMAGVQVGSVEKIDLVNPHLARFTLALNEDSKVPIGSEAVIEGSVIGLGDTPLEIVAPDNYSGFLSAGATLPGRKAGPLDSILPNGGRDVYSHINKTLASVQQLLQDRRLQNDLKHLLETANTTLAASQATLAKFNALAGHTDDLLLRNEGNITAMVQSTRGAIEQVRYTAGTLANFVREGKLQKGTTDLLDRAVHIESQASSLLAELNKTVSSPGLKKDLADTLHNVKETSDRGPAIADNAKKITDNMAVITEKAKPLPDTLNEVAKKASVLEDKISSLVDKFNGIKPPSAGGLKGLSTELDEIRETSIGHWRTDVNASLPTHDGFVTFGVYDAFEANHLNLQIGHNALPSLDYRYGVYASKPGVGVDYALSSKLGLRTDLWDVNSPEFDAKLRYDFGGGVIGWAGVERIFSKASPAFGIGIRR